MAATEARQFSEITSSKQQLVSQMTWGMEPQALGHRASPRLISFPVFRHQCLNSHLSTTPTQSTMSEHEARVLVPAHSKSSSCLLYVHFAPGSLSLLHMSVVGTSPESAPALCQSTQPDYLLTELRWRGGSWDAERILHLDRESPAFHSHWTFFLSL